MKKHEKKHEGREMKMHDFDANEIIFVFSLIENENPIIVIEKMKLHNAFSKKLLWKIVGSAFNNTCDFEWWLSHLLRNGVFRRMQNGYFVKTQNFERMEAHIRRTMQDDKTTLQTTDMLDERAVIDAFQFVNDPISVIEKMKLPKTFTKKALKDILKEHCDPENFEENFEKWFSVLLKNYVFKILACCCYTKTPNFDRLESLF